MILDKLGAVGQRVSACWTGNVSDPTLSAHRVTAVARVAVGAAQEPHEGVGTPGEAAASTVARPALRADLLHTIEQGGIDWRGKPRRSLLFVGQTLVTDRTPGIERIREHLLDAELAEAELQPERVVRLARWRNSTSPWKSSSRAS